MGLAAALVAVLGPVAGEYAAILFAALAGALWPLSARKGITRGEGALLLLRLVATSVVLTGMAAYYVHQYTGVPVLTAMSEIAGGLAPFIPLALSWVNKGPGWFAQAEAT